MWVYTHTQANIILSHSYPPTYIYRYILYEEHAGAFYSLHFIIKYTHLLLNHSVYRKDHVPECVVLEYFTYMFKISLN